MGFDEFVRVMASIYERKFTDEEMQRAFKCFDADNSGKINLHLFFILFFYLKVILPSMNYVKS